MTAAVTIGDTFSATKPQLLVQGFPGGVDGSAYSVSPDGLRFVVVSDTPEQPATQINLVLNWFEELKRKVPTGR